jgi:hypothetical protein
MKPSVAQRLRQHPDDPNVWEYDVDYIRTLFPRTPCRGCPAHNKCEPGVELESERDCSENTVWYGHHIEIANKLEGA